MTSFIGEGDRLLQTTDSQLDRVGDSQGPSWCDTALRACKLILWVLASAPLITIPWTKSHIVEHWSALFCKTEEQGIPAVATAPGITLGNGYGSVGSVDRRVILDLKATDNEEAQSIKRTSNSDKGSVDAYIDFLAQKYGDRAVFIPELADVAPQESFLESKVKPEVIKAIQEGKQFVFIPIVQASKKKDHTVLFILNLHDRAIEFYDPKGNAPGATEIRALPGTSVEAFRRALSNMIRDPISRQFGESQNPDLVELRDLLAETDNDQLQVMLQDSRHRFTGAYSKLSTKVTFDEDAKFFGYRGDVCQHPPVIGHLIQSTFGYQGSSIPELKKVIEACQKSTPLDIQRALSSVKSYALPQALKMQVDNCYIQSFDPETLESDAQQELDRMESIQYALMQKVDHEIMQRGKAQNPYRDMINNYSYGSKTPHQKATSSKNSELFVMHFMKMRLEQSLIDQTEARAFRAAAEAVKTPSEIRSELVADLKT